MLSLDEKRELFRKYRTTRPDDELEVIFNPITRTYEKYTIRELVDSVWKKIREIEAQREINLRRRATEEKRIEEVRKHNLLIRDLEMSGIRVRKR